MKIKPEETELKGNWIQNGTNLEEDPICNRIEWLIEHSLNKICEDESGWDTLYQDANDSRYWELVYPQSHLHGGGPPMLKYLPYEIARNKYNFS